MSNVIPKKLIKYRKEKYPIARDNYRKYKNATWIWIDILQETKSLKDQNIKNYIDIISKKYNIKYGTLKDKFSKWNKSNYDDLFNNNAGAVKKLISQSI